MSSKSESRITPRPFYYNKYYKKTFNVKHYGVDTNLALLSYIKATSLRAEGP